MQVSCRRHGNIAHWTMLRYAIPMYVPHHQAKLWMELLDSHYNPCPTARRNCWPCRHRLMYECVCACERSSYEHMGMCAESQHSQAADPRDSLSAHRDESLYADRKQKARKQHAQDSLSTSIHNSKQQGSRKHNTKTHKKDTN